MLFSNAHQEIHGLRGNDIKVKLGYFTGLCPCLQIIALLMCLFLSKFAVASESKLEMTFIEDDGSLMPQIEGGSQMPAKEWRATVKFHSKTASLCTGTLIGEGVIITAAHCMPEAKEGKETPITLKQKKLGVSTPRSISGSCESHPNFIGGDKPHNDLALCKLNGMLDNEPLHETLALTLPIALSKPIFLLGYGCRDVNAAARHEYGVTGYLYGGGAVIQSAPDVENGLFQVGDGVTICPGDSGGAAYILNDFTKRNAARSIVGLNSAVDPRTMTSYITSIRAIDQGFLKSWAKRNNVRLCGVHADATNCRKGYTWP